eukprot:Transcript_21930.p1 GENE.Transcript_21930~~Transcript_21930.p1  ORF type:complete len:847 (+),score=396.79 Transcript_21930:160-2700(+)
MSDGQLQEEIAWWHENECVAVSDMTKYPDAKDDCCPAGLLMPDLPHNAGYLIIALLCLCYVFLGVALGADVFMTSIEIITSKEKTIKVNVNGEKKIFHTQVWNATVANLTLMALGSSAPEILLNVVDVFKESFHASKLGPGTIVGSAAFNLLVITAVCVVAIPAGEKRTIKSMGVFICTAVWSVFAYIWLLIMLIVWTPDIITVAEAALTCVFLVILILQAYAIDVYWDRVRQKASAALGSTKKLINMRTGSVDKNMIMEEIKKRQEGQSRQGQAVKSADQIAQELADEMPKTKGHYRRSIMAAATGRHAHNIEHVGKDQELKVVKVDEGDIELHLIDIFVGLCRRVVAVVEGVDHTASVLVRRQGPAEVGFAVRLKTEEGTAKAGKHFRPVDTTLDFAPGVMELTHEIQLIDNDEVEHEDVTFQVHLSEQKTDDPGHKVVLGGELQFASCKVQIRDDDRNPGTFRWHSERIEVPESCGHVNVTVLRTGGLSGEVTIQYATKDQTATAGKDYVAQSGTLTFAHGVVSQSLTIEIIDDDKYENDETFTVVLSEPTGGATFDKNTDGGAATEVCTVVILNDDEITTKAEMVAQILRLNTDNIALAGEDWVEQLRGAIIPEGGATAKEKFMHFLNVPWKLMFAIVPPPGMCGGFPCFVGSLIMIGVQVVLISDFASLMGCQMGLKPAVTAITFVALGTSLPDTFASMAAARGDKYADNSIGNVTGSNSVNVFLGLGLAWLISAIYWDPDIGVGANEDWMARYPDIYAKQVARGEKPGGFVVRAGDLGFSVLIFTICALIALGTILLRRPNELGGNRTYAKATAGLFVGLWLVYVVLSSLSAYKHIVVEF